MILQKENQITPNYLFNRIILPKLLIHKRKEVISEILMSLVSADNSHHSIYRPKRKFNEGSWNTENLEDSKELSKEQKKSLPSHTP